jgi:hypothetical protein
MKKAILFILMLPCIVCVFTGCSNKYGDVSDYQARPLEGVSMQVKATSRSLTYSVYTHGTGIKYSEFQEDMQLEKLINGEWRQIPQTSRSYAGLGHGGGTFTKTIKWKTYYDANLSKGNYRLIFSFSTDDFNDIYNVVAEFSID